MVMLAAFLLVGVGASYLAFWKSGMKAGAMLFAAFMIAASVGGMLYVEGRSASLIAEGWKSPDPKAVEGISGVVGFLLFLAFIGFACLTEFLMSKRFAAAFFAFCIGGGAFYAASELIIEARVASLTYGWLP